MKKLEFSEDERYKTVRKANELIQRARYKLSLQQQKIVLYLIAQISPFDAEFHTYELGIADFCRVCGIDNPGGKDYAELRSQIKAIADKSMWLRLEDGSGTALVRWIESPVIRENAGVIELRLSEALRPYLLNLKSNFTQYDLIYTLHFKSKYSIRLYELVCSIHFRELDEYKRRFSLDELRRLLDCETYTEYKNFRRFVLEKAIDEINDWSDKTLSYCPLKKGRFVIGIELTITTKGPLERLRVLSRIDAEMGVLEGQTSLFQEFDP